MKKDNGKTEEIFDLSKAPEGTVRKSITQRTSKGKEYLKYDFTREEKEEMGIELAQKFGELSQKEADKKAIVKSLDSDISSLEAKTRDIATKLSNGHEYKNIDVEITFDYESRLKRFRRLDTGAEYKEVPMTADELQVPLPLTEEVPDEEAA